MTRPDHDTDAALRRRRFVAAGTAIATQRDRPKSDLERTAVGMA
ncbi:hypothetical protein [Agromyces sp. NPDC057865]